MSLPRMMLLVACLAAPSAATLAAGESPRDAHAIAQLRDAGSDLAKPHRIDFFLVLDDEATAGRVATLLRGRGFAARVAHAEAREQWSVVLSRTMVPDERDLGALRDEFNAVVATEGGRYEGWGAGVVR